MCSNNPYWQWWNYNNFVEIWYSYLRYTDRLLDVFFLLLIVVLSELHENPRRKDCVTENSTKKYLREEHHLLATRPPYVIFFCFFCPAPPPPLLCPLPPASVSGFEQSNQWRIYIQRRSDYKGSNQKSLNVGEHDYQAFLLITSQLVTDTKKCDGMIVDVITDLRKKHKRIAKAFIKKPLN